MARYRGPKWRISRRENFDIFGNDKWKKRAFPPGMHNTKKGRPSNYAIQFREKQKLKRIYGLLEKQFRRIYQKASREKGNTGIRFLQLLEMRLDNVSYRLGYAKSRNQARQFVSHGHIFVNGKRINIPSYTLTVNDTIEFDPKFAKTEVSKLIIAETKKLNKVSWLNNGQITMLPPRDTIDQAIRENLVVEFYSR
ncbi:MAG: 30S ribosomal protein S4 [bacterium]